MINKVNNIINVKKYNDVRIIDVLLEIYDEKYIEDNIATVKLDDKLVCFNHKINNNSKLELFSFDSKEGRDVLNHSTSHIMAEAVVNIFNDAKLAIGPSIKNGFYYDFDHSPFSNEDLLKIEKEMKRILKNKRYFESYFVSKKESLIKEKDQPYKLELINDLSSNVDISFVKQGDFEDLCGGAHLYNSKHIKNFKLISTSGAYWRGDEKNNMLSRIYGVSFKTKEELDSYLEKLEKIKLIDHNKLGRDLNIFTTVNVIGKGLPLFMPNGTIILKELQRWIEDLEDNEYGYIRTKTPYLAKSDLYKISGHWDHYKEHMFLINDKEDIFSLRPMTCPFQYYIYKANQHSYKELPIRYSETSTLFRNEQNGEMHGLIRLKQFTLAEGHLIIRPDQVEEEFKNCFKLCNHILKTLGLEKEVTYRFSKWDKNNKEKYLGSEEYWENTQNIIKNILDDCKVKYEEADGEAAFYGPKVDIQICNVYGKEDTLITIQLDNIIAEKFDMYYIDADGKKKTPYIIHRSSLGCYERTLALLIEHFEGKLPLWLSPEQVRILTISSSFDNYANVIQKKLKQENIRCSIDARNEKIGYKIRDAKIKKIPYLLIIGEKEEKEQIISVNSMYNDIEKEIKLEDFILKIKNIIKNKEIKK